jgi:hypothetical protein
MDFSKTVEMSWEEPPKEEPTNQASLFE